MQNKICPIMSIDIPKKEVWNYCEREKCAWFTPSKECAILTIAHQTANIFDELKGRCSNGGRKEL